MALIVGGTTVTGTQTLDATKLAGDLPNISGASLTGITTAPTSITDGVVSAAANNTGSITAPSNGVAFIWNNQSTSQGSNTIGSARNGGTATAYNAGGDETYLRWVKISY